MINGEEFFSIRELEEILNLNFIGVFCFLRPFRIRCARIGNCNYASKKDILKTLDPGTKSNRALIERIRGEGNSLK